MIHRLTIRSFYPWLILICLILEGLIMPSAFLNNLGFVNLAKGVINKNDTGHLMKAQTVFESANHLKSDTPGTLYGLTLATHFAGLNDQSIHWAEQGIRITSDDPFMQLALGDALYANDQSEEAITQWRKSGSAPLLKIRAIAAERQLNWPLAEKWYTIYLRLQPQDGNAIVQLAVIYRKQNKLSQAEDVLEEYLASAPKDPVAYHQLGLVYLGQSRTSEAALAFSKAIELDSTDYWSTLYLSNIDLFTNNLERANALSYKAIQINPDYPTPYFNLGRIAALQHNWQDAGGEFMKAIEFAQNWNIQHKIPTIGSTELAKYYLELAQVKFETGSFSEAREAAEQAVYLDPANDQAREILDRVK